MSSGQFSSVAISSIIVDRDNRQRRELKEIASLRDSIQRLGLLNPIIIRREDNVLVAGERRLTAVTELGWTHIPVHFTDEIDPIQLHLIELEENTKRLDISWQEECAAVLEYERLQRSLTPEWTSRDTAEALRMSETDVSRKKDVAVALEKNDERVAAAPKLSTAINIVARSKAREKSNELLQLFEEEGIEEEKPEAPFIHADFIEWQKTYTGTPFNLIHCDFPYGINADKHDQGVASYQPLKLGSYDDSPDVYWNLVDALAAGMKNVVAPSAHLMFWFSMDYYTDTLAALTEMGWKVNPFPLIWHKSDNTGVLPDPSRGPRRTYETAFLASRGDRQIVQAVANSFGHPGRDKSIHMSEKPRTMLHHYLRMLVDEYTILLDPTAGSGNAVTVAASLGAPVALGLEKDREFYERACEAYLNG